MDGQPQPRRLRRGDVREDGKVFWRYNKRCRTGEQWVERAVFEKWRENDRKYRQSERGREVRRKSFEKWFNSDKRRETRRKYQARRRKCPIARTEDAIRGHACRAARLAGQNKPASSFELLGTDMDGFRAHMESLFLPGMDWDNYGAWECDHVIPLASAKTSEELWGLCHYTNLQPLWAEDNRRKGAKLPENFSPNT